MRIDNQTVNIIREMGYEISCQSHSSIIVTAIAAEIFSNEQLQNQIQSLQNRLENQGYSNFRIHFFANNQFEIIDEQAATEELSNWADDWNEESEQEVFEEGLNNWANDAREMVENDEDAIEGIEEAFERVQEAFDEDNEELILDELGLKSLPAEIGKLSHLKSLYLYNNALTSLPLEIGNLRNLQELDLSGNKDLANFPAQIGNLQALEILWLEGNTLEHLPLEIGSLSNLKTIKVDGNLLVDIDKLTESMTFAKQISEMGFSASDPSNGSIIVKIKPETESTLNQNPQLYLQERLQQLGYNKYQVYSIRKGQFKIIYDAQAFEDGLKNWETQEIERAKNDEFSIEGIQCAIKRIKEAFYRHTDSLDLDELGLKSLPAELGQLTHLESLYLSQNELTNFPPEISHLYKLARLVIEENRLTSLPLEICDLPNLIQLDLDGNQLDCLPSEIGNLLNLIRFNVNDNKLIGLPAEIGDLSKLKQLRLGQNLLTDVPPEISHLSNLEELELSSNQLANFPAEIGNLINLKQLRLDHNQLSSVSIEIGDCSNLEELELNHNQLESLPVEIEDLQQLKYLNLSNNRLISLTPQISALRQLNHLEISDNPHLTTLPLSLGLCSQLTNIDIDNTQIPQSNVTAILNLCAAQRNAKAEHILPVRLQAWIAFSGESCAFDFIDALSLEEKCTINEWLVRLERTRDFTTASQQSLAQAVCKILHSLKEVPSFNESFFAQVTSNLECCGDRAAMAFNELYLAWNLATLDPDMSEKDKFALIVRASKTVALRNALQNRIAIKESEQKEEAESKYAADEYILESSWQINEDVEIYLFYEINLKERLNLLTFMNDMSYSHIGERDWIDTNSLIQEVEESYFKHIIDFPSFLKIRDADENYDLQWKALQEGFISRFEELEKQLEEKTLEDGDYFFQLNTINKERNEAQKSLSEEWLREKLENNKRANSKKRSFYETDPVENEQSSNKKS